MDRPLYAYSLSHHAIVFELNGNLVGVGIKTLERLGWTVDIEDVRQLPRAGEPAGAKSQVQIAPSMSLKGLVGKR